MVNKTLTQPTEGSAKNNGAIYGAGDVTKAATENLMNENYSNSTIVRNSDLAGTNTLENNDLTGTNTLENNDLAESNSGIIPSKQTNVTTGEVVDQDSLIS